jgi:hypothetical protein
VGAWKPEDYRIYHGIDGEDGISRIYVERAEYGPTERETRQQEGRLRLGQLHAFDEEDGGGFGWGYNGGGTSRAAAAILADALNEPQERYDFTADDEQAVRLREDFCEDVLSQCCREWRLGRGAVLRWVRGWYAQHGNIPTSTTLTTLPPIDRNAFRQP